MGGYRGAICSIVRRPPLDIHVLPRALRDDGGVDVVPALQLSHRVGKPCPIISVLGGGSISWRWSRGFRLACHARVIPGRRISRKGAPVRDEQPLPVALPDGL
jgi:hypothetical protein